MTSGPRSDPASPLNDPAFLGKPPSLASALEFAHRRIDALTEICKALALQSDPVVRSTLLAQLAIVLGNVNDDG